MRFKYFDHTADAMFESYGKDIEEAFSNAALAMFNILTDIAKVSKVKAAEVKAEADTYEKLLFDFFDELLYLLDTEHLIISEVSSMDIKRKKGKLTLSCTVQGDIASNYETHGDIKAPTYNEMEITINEEGAKIRAVVDI